MSLSANYFLRMILSYSQAELQLLTNLSASACNNFGLTINIAKSDVLYRPPPSVPYVEPHVNIDNVPLSSVTRLTILAVFFPAMLQSQMKFKTDWTRPILLTAGFVAEFLTITHFICQLRYLYTEQWSSHPCFMDVKHGQLINVTSRISRNFVKEGWGQSWK